jgi:hypothetical protein
VFKPACYLRPLTYSDVAGRFLHPSVVYVRIGNKNACSKNNAVLGTFV